MNWRPIVDFSAYDVSDRGWVADHVVAVARGGSSHIANIVPACGTCNPRKKDRPVFWMADR